MVMHLALISRDSRCPVVIMIPKQHAACAAARRRTDRWRAKFELLHTVRTHMGASDANYGCVVQREDATGKVSYRARLMGSIMHTNNNQRDSETIVRSNRAVERQAQVETGSIWGDSSVKYYRQAEHHAIQDKVRVAIRQEAVCQALLGPSHPDF